MIQSRPTPTRSVMLVSESPETRAVQEERLLAAGYGVEVTERIGSMVLNATHRHYDAIVIDIEGENDVMTGVMEFRRIESGRGQPPTPIVGLGDVDGLARSMAQQAGFSDLISPVEFDPSILIQLESKRSLAQPAA